MVKQRENKTESLKNLTKEVTQAVYKKASLKKQKDFCDAERKKEVFSAWNAVCEGTREGVHVTGLHYISSDNTLIVYLDAPSWTQEMTMLREIIRARMKAQGIEINGFIFKTSKTTQTKKCPRIKKTKKRSVPHTALTPQEEQMLNSATTHITDKKLREALKRAEKANLEWKKGIQSKETSETK